MSQAKPERLEDRLPESLPYNIRFRNDRSRGSSNSGGLEHRRAGSGVIGLPAFWAAVATILVLAWQIATVQANYSGNCSGLFRTGTQTSVPPGLIPTTYRDASLIGYDGQFYRFLAHDPLLRKGTAAYLDRLRSRRILVPVLAWVITRGHPQFIDDGYVLVLAGFIFVGVYWLGCLMLLQGQHTANGLLFLAVPATVVSIDRMTVDVALAALTAGLALQFVRGRELWLWPILSAAVLVREAGLLLVAACALAALARHEFKKVLAWLSAAIPALCWYGYSQHVFLRAAVDTEGVVPKWVFPSFRLGILMRALDPPRYQLPHQQEAIARGMDSLALLGMIATAGMAVWLLRHTQDLSLRLALSLHAALMAAWSWALAQLGEATGPWPARQLSPCSSTSG